MSMTSDTQYVHRRKLIYVKVQEPRMLAPYSTPESPLHLVYMHKKYTDIHM